MPSTTTNYSFNKPTVGADDDAWGGYLNTNWDTVDTLLAGAVQADFTILSDHSSLLDVTTNGTSEASKVVTADANGNVKLVEEVQATCYIDTTVALSGTSVTVDCDEGNMFTLTTSGNTTFTFDYSGVNLTTNDGYGFVLKITAGGTHTLTWPSSVEWSGGLTPTDTASGETDIFTFLTFDGGTTWYGFQIGDDMS